MILKKEVAMKAIITSLLDLKKKGVSPESEKTFIENECEYILNGKIAKCQRQKHGRGFSLKPSVFCTWDLHFMFRKLFSVFFHGSF